MIYIFLQTLVTAEFRMTSTQKYRDFVGESIAGKAVEAIPGIGNVIGQNMRGMPNSMSTVSYGELMKME